MRINLWMKGFLAVLLTGLAVDYAPHPAGNQGTTSRPKPVAAGARVLPPGTRMSPRKRPIGFARTTGLLKVALIPNENGLSDKGFNHLAYLGLLRAASEYKIETAVAQPSSSLDYAKTIESYAAKGFNLIICVGYLMDGAVRQVAMSYPNTQFVVLDDSITNVPNVTGVVFRTEESGYLAGALSGLLEVDGSHLPGMNAQNVVGIIGGVPISPVNSYIAGFIQGVKHTDPTVTIVKKYTDTFSDTGIGWDAADQEIVSGADIIFQVAAHAGIGVFQACHESGVYAIGVDSNQTVLDPQTIITNAVKGIDSATINVIRQAQNGRLKSGTLFMSAVDGGVRLSIPLPIVPKHLVHAVDELTTELQTGKIQVSSTLQTSPRKKT